MITSLNRGLAELIGAALSPFEALPPLVGLSVVALAVAIGMLLVVRAASDQRAIIAVKRRIQAGLFEIRLFNDDVRVFSSVRDVLRHNLTYLRLSLVPLVWMILPLALLIAQLQFYYGYDGFSPGQSAIVTVRMREAAAGANGAAPSLTLAVPPGVRVQTPALWIPSEREAAWRIGFDQRGDYELVVSLDGRQVTKSVRVSERPGYRAPGRFQVGWVNQLLYPAEPPIAPEVPIEVIRLTYPERELHFLGGTVSWMVMFFGLSMIFGWGLRSRFGVEL